MTIFADMITLDDIRKPVTAELEAFDEFVDRQFTAEGELLSDMLRYALSARGKGIRPMLVMLSAAMNAPVKGAATGRRACLAAMLVEMIHVASLIHDDVIDEADMRRGKPSANARWQSHKAVILGDYILAKNMNIGLQSGQFDLVTHVCGSMAALWIAMGIFAVVFFVLAAVRIPEPFAIQNAKSEKKDKHSAMSFRHFVLGTVAIFIYVGVEVGIPNFMNLFLTSAPDAATPGIGMAAAAAGSLVGTYWFLMMCGRLIGGVIGGKVSSKAQLTVVSIVALAFVLLGIFAPIDTMGRMPVFTGTGFAMIEVPIGVMFLTLCGLCTSVLWGGIFNLAVEGLGKSTSMGSGIFLVMVCGGGILPLIQGYVADISNYLSSYWVIIAGLAYMLFYALVGSKNVNKDIPVDETMSDPV